MTTEEFIKLFREEDIRSLALQGSRYPEVDMPFALNQIGGWQIARTKLPSWAIQEGILYPPHLSMEQCSSEKTALYKARLVTGKSMADLTGGFGVDFSFMAREFEEACYVERQQELCSIAEHNMKALGLKHANVVCDNAEKYLRTMQPVDVIYLDPARRDATGNRTYAIEDCTPNVLSLKEELLMKAQRVMVKLSPMLDWHKALHDIPEVTEVHIVATQNECKELLLVMERPTRKKPFSEQNYDTRIVCVNDDTIVSYTLSELLPSTIQIALPMDDATRGTLYEPNVTLMKAGCFSLLCQRYGVMKIAKDSNLFFSDEIVDFPGRSFTIEGVSTLNKKELKTHLRGIERANIAVRNFPLTAEELRKRLKLKDGGDHYLFGTTDSEGKHVIIITRKQR